MAWRWPQTPAHGGVPSTYSSRTCSVGPCSPAQAQPRTRHIPVQILTIEDERQYGLERGAFSFNQDRDDRPARAAIDRLKDFTTSRTRP